MVYYMPMEKILREVSEPIRKLYQAFLLGKIEVQTLSEEDVIVVDEVIGKMSSFYEKIRNLLNDAQEHLFRKKAISRYLARREFFDLRNIRDLIHGIPSVDYRKWAETLIRDLIRSGYVKNKAIPRTHIDHVAWIIQKNLFLRHCIYPHLSKKIQKDVHQFLGDLIANEIEEILSPNANFSATVGSMYELLRGRIIIQGKNVSAEEKDLQLYIAILRVVWRADKGTLRYQLFSLYFPQWVGIQEEQMKKCIVDFFKTYRKIERDIADEMNQRLAVKLKPYQVSYEVLREFSVDNPKDAYRDIQIPDELKLHVTQTLEKKYRKIRGRIFRSAWRSVVYIFITKMIVAILIEYPYDVFIANKINFTALLINILFPPILMFILTITIGIPMKKNTVAVFDTLMQILFKKNVSSIQIVVKPKNTLLPFWSHLFRLLYIAMYIFIFWSVISLLRLLAFNPVNIIIFLFFLFVITFFSMRIRSVAKEVIIIPRKENIFTFFLDIVGIPIIRAGRWLSMNLSKINVFVFIMDFFIEAPFKLFVEVVEGWIRYLREKKEELY